MLRLRQKKQRCSNWCRWLGNSPYGSALTKAPPARLDSDVLHWLKSQGKGYQSRMNEILRKEMLASMKP
jgi:hypothetical protein